MFFAEPQPTQYDLNFMIGDVPVRVHPMFWLMTVLLGASNPQPILVGLWVVAVFISILVHEFGHVLAFRYFGMRSHVVLQAMGGLAIPDTMSANYGRQRNWISDIAIAFAGPAAGFAFAALICVVLKVSGGDVMLVKIDRSDLIPMLMPVGLPTEYSYLFVFRLLEINIFWGLLNLLPVFPLDGGQIAAAVLRKANPHDGLRQALMLSVGTAIGMAVLALVKMESTYMAMFFGFMAYNSYQILQSLGGGRSGWR